jgi:hypothetical protein
MSLSSIPIMVTIVVLLSPQPRPRALAFLIAWVVGMAAVLYACIALASAIPLPSGEKVRQPVIALVIIAVGVALVILGIFVARGPRRAAGMPGWLTAVGSVGWPKAAGLALVLNIRPKALLLSIAAGLTVRGQDLTTGQSAALIIIYTVIGAASVAWPIVYAIVAPVRAEAWLVVARGWVERNNTIVTLVILVLVGVVIVGEGISRL